MTSDIPASPTGVKNWFSQRYHDAMEASAPQALIIGCASGACAGIVCKKVGNTAAAALGGSLLIFRLAEHLGYIQVNWKKVDSKLDKALDKAKDKISSKDAKREFKGFFKEITVFVKNNTFLVSGFGGGFFIGLSLP